MLTYNCYFDYGPYSLACISNLLFILYQIVFYKIEVVSIIIIVILICLSVALL